MKKLVVDIVDNIGKEKNKEVKIPKCWICMDRGLIYYDKKEHDIRYETVARCRCVRGQNMGDRIGDIPDVLIDDIARINFENFKEAYPEEAKRLIGGI